MTTDYFDCDISRYIWESRYRFRDAAAVHDHDIADTWRRVAHACAAAEENERAEWEERFYGILESFRFLPGGRILAGAGTARRVTLFNCFVMGAIADSMDGIFDALKEGALTMQQGGGVGYDFTTLRPHGFPAGGVGSVASGPVSFMQIWDAMCATLISTGSRRGAMMATLRCEHPDIEQFVAAKGHSGRLSHFNLSILASDAFMEAVRDDRQWPLLFPTDGIGARSRTGELVIREWPGYPAPVLCTVLRTIAARDLWAKIMHATYDYAEPGVLFIDRINRENNLWYRERICATNPCGEIPLPPYGACDLGSVNLTRFVERPFESGAQFAWEEFRDTVRIAVRLLDDVIDVSGFPLPAQDEQARGSRRLGLGVTGLADALIMLGMTYGDEASLEFARRVMEALRDTAFAASVELARTKGPFPFFQVEPFQSAPFIAGLPERLRDAIARHGIRNSHLIAIAPTGTISLLANNVSSSIEPVFNFSYTRKVLEPDGTRTEYRLTDYAWRLWRATHGADETLPQTFVDALDLAPETHLALQAAIQPYVDNAISKTINVPEDYSFEDFKNLYQRAYELGLKGCTTFRPNPITGEVLAPIGNEVTSHCCNIEREGG